MEPDDVTTDVAEEKETKVEDAPATMPRAGVDDFVATKTLTLAQGSITLAVKLAKIPALLRFKCIRKKGESICGGVLEDTPENLASLKFGGHKCPKCNQQFSSGRRIHLVGEQSVNIAEFFNLMKKAVMDYEVELVLDMTPDLEAVQP